MRKTNPHASARQHGDLLGGSGCFEPLPEGVHVGI